ncbi:MAG TPA: NAD(P)-dependent oxidoreductase, partial [Salinimicrobium sp.]|nr:NAD(P)-dependent oxidoreductase [Salinimicrobium sp.]
AQDEPVIAEEQFKLMKDGVGIINAARGGVINEVDLFKAIEDGKVSFAGLDVFENEPTPAVQILMNHKISLSPHIGGQTNEAQDRIGTELAEQIIEILK